jgi:biopolymer transport protein TolR
MYIHSKRKKRLMGEINVVPYIDVMLVLLVIFMVTAPLLTEGVRIDMVEADANPIESKSEEPFVVHVDRDGKYYLNDDKEPRTAQALRAAVTAVLRRSQETNSKPPDFLVRGDRNVAYGKVVQAMAHMQQAGVPSVGLITQPPDNE